MRRPVSKRAASLALAMAALGCRPDPYALLLRTIEPGEVVELPDGMTLVAEARDGAALRGVTVTGRARSCDGTLELVAPEVRLERGDGERGAVKLVLERPVAEERCGGSTVVTRHDRLTLYLDE